MTAHPTIFHQDRYRLPRRILRDWLLRPIGFRFLVKITIEGVENIPTSGPTLLVMNHIAAIDPVVVVGAAIPRFVVPMSKVENYRHPVFGLIARVWGVYPVRRGEIDRQALNSTIELLRQERPVLIAPEGTRQPALAEAKDGMTYVAVKTGAVLVPVGVDGTQDFLRALKHLRRAHVTVKFGQPFRFRTDGRPRIPRDDMRQMTQEAMYQLAALLPEHRRGVYHDLSEMTTDTLEFVD